MTIVACVGRGLRQAWRRPALAATLWLWTVILGLVAALPARAVFGGAFNLAPESDQLLGGFNFRLLIEAIRGSRATAPNMLFAVVIAVGFVALVGNAFFAGGVLEVLVTSDRRSFLHRFMRGAGHFFGRFLRLLVFCALSAAACGFLATLVLFPVGRVLSRTESEAWRLAANFLTPAAILVLVAFFWMVLDYARVRMVLDGRRSAFKAWFAALWFVVRHLVGTTGIRVAFGVLGLGVFALSAWYQTSAGSNVGSLILALILVQQATLFVRSALRMGDIAAALEFARLKNFPAAAVVVPAMVSLDEPPPSLAGGAEGRPEGAAAIEEAPARAGSTSIPADVVGATAGAPDGAAPIGEPGGTSSPDTA